MTGFYVRERDEVGSCGLMGRPEFVFRRVTAASVSGEAVEAVKEALMAWAEEHPWCDTQGVIESEWLQMAWAAVAALVDKEERADG